MIKYHNTNNNKVIAELTDRDFVICGVEDTLDLIGDLGANGCNRMIIYKGNLHEDFFDLRTGLAGEILQKFSNYNFRLAIAGDFSGHKSKSLNDFIRESNRRGMICFTGDFESAMLKLS
jgi:hypothetical protein